MPEGWREVKSTKRSPGFSYFQEGEGEGKLSRPWPPAPPPQLGISKAERGPPVVPAELPEAEIYPEAPAYLEQSSDGGVHCRLCQKGTFGHLKGGGHVKQVTWYKSMASTTILPLLKELLLLRGVDKKESGPGTLPESKSVEDADGMAIATVPGLMKLLRAQILRKLDDSVHAQVLWHRALAPALQALEQEGRLDPQIGAREVLQRLESLIQDKAEPEEPAYVSPPEEDEAGEAGATPTGAAAVGGKARGRGAAGTRKRAAADAGARDAFPAPSAAPDGDPHDDAGV